MNNHPQQIFGYSDRFAARPGEALSFHVSCEHVTNYQASLVRLRHGFTGEAGPGFLETPVPADFEGTYRGAWFACQPGSYVEVPDESGVLATPDDVLIEAHIFPTLPQGTRSGQFGAYHVTQNSFGESSGMQAVLGNWSETTKSGYALILDQGKPTFIWNDGTSTKKLSLDAAVEAHHWYKLRVRVVASEGKVHLEQVPVDNIMNRHTALRTGSTAQSASATISRQWSTSEAPFRIGALARRDGYRWLASSAFNGKIGGITIWRGASESAQDVVAAWHFGLSSRADGLLLGDVIDQSANKLNGRCHNVPTRGVAGHRFSGLVEDFRLVPNEYDAIHFHDDDITDAEWPAAFTFKIPEELPAGVYAVKLTSEDAEYYIPFFVRAGQNKAEIAVLFSTVTYLAYANDRIAFEANGAEIIVSRTPIIDRADLTLQDHPEFCV